MNRTAAEAAAWLGLAAAPTFAVMAAASVAAGGGPMASLCQAAGGGPLDGMAVMYLLMSAFHLGPWLKRMGRIERGDD